jgi:ribonucleoside-diphosphate reductase alpha chain
MTSLRFLPNSPTLGNAGRPLQQLSACFVLPIEDSMASIFESVKETALIHQSGGGTGFGFSRLRPAGDIVRSTGGIASGPVSFMRVFDAATEAIKQGGTRRGANMAILDVHHPDIEAFINVKADMVTLTNFNISVAVDEAFMRAVESDAEYDLVNPRTGAVVATRRARDIFDQIVANAWRNGDPGLVFLDRINADNPTPALGRIEATNPCGEQPLLPYESCNLGSLNLARFVKPTGYSPSPRKERGPGGEVSSEARGESEMPRGLARGTASQSSPSPRRERGPGGEVPPMPGVSTPGAAPDPVAGSLLPAAVDWDALASVIPVAVRFLDDVIDMNSYPVEAIATQTRLTRKIGLGVMGWADLLYQLDIPYDSEAALDLADRLMAFIRAHADAASEALALERGPFPAWPASIYGPEYRESSPSPRRERGPGGEVPPMPPASARGAVDPPMPGGSTPSTAQRPVRPLRNATRTTVAPTGTLSIIADCSGGIEPAFALAFTRQHYLDPKRPTVPVRLTEVNPVFEAVARDQGFYSQDLVDYLAAGGSLQQRDDVPADSKRRFVTAHEIAPEWHVRMQATFQRHVDNAVSKTINFPRLATEADVAAAYLLAYHQGCKGITIYRDGSRARQVLSHVAEGEGDLAAPPGAIAAADGGGFAPPVEAPHRRHMPDERRSLTHKFRVGEQEGFVTVGLFADGTPGEIFVTISKEGSTIRGLMDSVAMLTSYSLQYGVPLRTLVGKFKGVHFEPAGLTSNPQIPSATSLVDYIFRWLELRFLTPEPSSGEGAVTPAHPEALEGPPSVDQLISPSPRRERGSGGEVPPEDLALRPGPPGARPRPRRGATRGSAFLPPRPALPFSEVATGLLCPDCGSEIVFAEGCLTCRSCGYTRCG